MGMWNSKFLQVEEEPRIRSYAEVAEQVQDEEGHNTETSSEQEEMETDVLELYKLSKECILMRRNHLGLLRKSSMNLSEAHECLDCSRPWLCYWILHSFKILGKFLAAAEYSNIVRFLSKCQSPEGGFGGGPGQYPHLAPTYAAVNALCIIGTQEAYNVINRATLSRFLYALRGPEGEFSVHADGEVDLRGAYCAIAVAKLTNVLTPEMFAGTEKWIARCQTWEGGFGGCPGMEAHGGYTYCGLAALTLLGETDLCSLKSLLRWLVNKQMRVEGGFQGRTNKLVDGCYSFWQGGTFPLVHAILSKKEIVFNYNYWLFNQEALQEYLLICCQHPSGGLLDKPGKSRDIYHTCYGLSGYSIAQHSPRPVIVGSADTNTVEAIHPIYNLVHHVAKNALQYYHTLPIPD